MAYSFITGIPTAGKSSVQYKKEGERYGWKIFNDPREAERELLKIIGL